MADCMVVMSRFHKLVDSEPMFDSALNLYNKVLIMPELSDVQFKLAARRYVVFLSLKGDLDGIIHVQKKIVNRFPQHVAELSKLGEMQCAVRKKLAPQDVFEKVLELDQYIGENLLTD